MIILIMRRKMSVMRLKYEAMLPHLLCILVYLLQKITTTPSTMAMPM